MKTTALLFCLLISILTLSGLICASPLYGGSTSVTTDGIKFPDGTIQTTAAGSGSTPWITSGSSIYYNSGNVGIGKTSPNAKFEIAYSGTFEQQRLIQALAPNSPDGNRIHAFEFGRSDNLGDSAVLMFTPSSKPEDATFTINFWGIGDAMTITASSNVGIGTTSPSSKFDVRGSADLGRNGIINATVSSGNPNPSQAIAVRAELNGNPSDTQACYDAFTAINVGDSSGSASYTAFRVETGYTTAMQIQSGTIDYYPGNDLTFTNGSSNILTLKVDGNVGIGTTDPSYRLHVNGDAAGTSWTNLSSRDYKEDIRKVDETVHPMMLAKLMDVDITTYKYKEECGGNGATKLGFIAEEMPDEVLSEDGKGVDLYELLTMTIGAMKAQQKQIAAQQKENEILKSELAKIMARLQALEK